MEGHTNYFSALYARVFSTLAADERLAASEKSKSMPTTTGRSDQTAYGIFAQACWDHHKRQYPDELINKEIEEFKQQSGIDW
jgi:hypothetical protein